MLSSTRLALTDLFRFYERPVAGPAGGVAVFLVLLPEKD